jgi:hypothetical protein
MNHPAIGRKLGLYYCMLIMMVASLIMVGLQNRNLIILFALAAFVKAAVSVSIMVTMDLPRWFTSIQPSYTKLW